MGLLSVLEAAMQDWEVKGVDKAQKGARNAYIAGFLSGYGYLEKKLDDLRYEGVTYGNR